MFRHLGRVALLAVSTLFSAVLVAPPASADPPIDTYGEPYPLCGAAGETDGQYCVQSFLRNGVKVTPPPASAQQGTYDDPYVTSAGDAGVMFGVVRTTVDNGGRSSAREVDPAATWSVTVNTGSIVPRQLNGRVRDLQFVRGGSAATGHWFRVTFRPTPVAYADFDDEGPCVAGYWCGEDTTVATQVLKGYADAGVDDGTAWADVPELLGGYAGYTYVTNALDYAALRDADLNALEVKLGNPHLRAPGVRATGYYETVLPDEMMRREFHVVNPAALSKSSLPVRRVGSSSPVSYTVNRERGAVRVIIKDIGFSAPVYRIRPQPTPPGTPPGTTARRIDRHHVRMTFHAPRDGGARVTSYLARCRARTGGWHYARKAASPVTVGQLPRGKVSCHMRATNRLGAGSWTTLRRR